jgi:hypothetical protein
VAWTFSDIESWIAERGCIAMIGQVGPRERRQLEKAVKEGRLAKWRATWTAPLGSCGFAAGPLAQGWSREFHRVSSKAECP